MKFLETITFLGNDALVPIKDIEMVWRTVGKNGEEIHIKGKGKYEWVEHFGDDGDKAIHRYDMIKYILGVPKESDINKQMKDKKVILKKTASNSK